MYKSITLMLIMAVIIMPACRKSSAATTHTSLVGKWKLKEEKVSPGYPVTVWSQVKEDTYIEFKADGTLINTNSILSPAYDRYVILNDSVFTMKISGTTDSFNLRYHFTPSLLTINPPCFEECSYRYAAVAY